MKLGCNWLQCWGTMPTHCSITLLIVSMVCPTLVMFWLKSASDFSKSSKVFSLDFGLCTQAGEGFLTSTIFKEGFHFFWNRNIVYFDQHHYCLLLRRQLHRLIQCFLGTFRDHPQALFHHWRLMRNVKWLTQVPPKNHLANQ